VAAFSGYIRVSSVSGRAGASFISPDVQEQTIRRLAKAHGLELSSIVQELDVSGGRAADDRKLGELVRAVEAGDSGGIVVWKLSRFSRDLLDGVTVADRIIRAGGRLVAEDFDSNSGMSKAILGFLLGWAEEERDARRSGWRAAQERAVARGVHPTKTPIGYRRTEESTLVPDPETAERVLQAFQARAQGASLQECADIAGVSHSGVRAMLKSPTYLGHIRMGDMVNEEAHQPIVPVRTWQLAQRMWAGPAHRDGSTAGHGVLQGIVRCAECGYVCSVTSGGKRRASYSCRGRRVGNTCTRRAAASVAKVDAYVWPQLQERAGSVDLEAALEEFYDAQVAMTAADRELKAFLEGASIVAMGPDLYAAEVTRRRESLRDATEAYRQALDSQEALVESDGIQGRRELARRLLEGVTLHKASNGRFDPIESRVELHWR
jgi:DNA invertase Pin-like site-specific DNA recombinase